MEQEILQFLQIMGWAGVTGLFVWKVLAPLTKFFIKKQGGNNADALEKVEKLKNNDLHEVKESIKRLERNYDEIRVEQISQGKEISWLKAKINNKK